MLIWLADWLTQFDSGFNVFSYLTLRAILSTLTALLIAILIGPKMIRYLQRMQIGQTVRDDGPQSHLVKAGTPTMGEGNSGHTQKETYKDKKQTQPTQTEKNNHQNQPKKCKT